jgi:DNA invertase Pin-like site-specific DNA recombinase
MNTSELVTVQHLAREAIIYIRQSTPHQILSNKESLELQYALKKRAIDFGWKVDSIFVIDVDLGLTGASTEKREGFKEILTKVALGEVGIIFSYDVTRLSRNCSDWYPLLDICGYKQCLIADRDGVYDPGTTNGRLLLGMKGQLAELELSTIKARLTAGLLNKAQRGDLALSLPVGLVRDKNGCVHKDPNLEIQSRISLIFDIFLEKRTAAKVLRYFNENNLEIPRYDSFGELHWQAPAIFMITFILKNPAYAGAFAYGRSQIIRQSPTIKKIRQVPMGSWKILVKDKYPSYVDWETFEKIQSMLKDNYAEYSRNGTRGIPRPGAALLHGIVYCGECGHKMVVQYKKGNQYMCNYLRQQRLAPVCQCLPADPIDEYVIANFFEALKPIELDGYTQVIASQTETEKKINKAKMQLKQIIFL